MPEPNPLPSPARSTPPAGGRRPLVVRLRNWVGDVVLALPMLERLADAGFAPVLVGKGWARELLAGTGWPVHALPATRRERVALLARLGAEARAGARASGQAAPPRRAIDALCLPDSLSSALEFRLAGLRALGHAWEGRSLLLGRAVPRPRATHEFEVYWRLGSALLGADAPRPARVRLVPTEAQRRAAAALREAHGLPADVIVICPFAGGTWNGQSKAWPGFAGFVEAALPVLGRRVVVCPGPGDEERIAREQFAGATLLAGVNLGVYAALLEDAAAMLAVDTGPAHLAAAVGAPLVSVFGPSDPALWRPWTPDVTLLGGHGHWPDGPAVLDALRAALAR